MREIMERNLEFAKILCENCKSEWFTENEIIADYPSLLLRKFSEGKETILVVPPHAGHSSTICDFDEEQSLIQTAVKTGAAVYAIEWKSCTSENKNEGIEELTLQLLAASMSVPKPFTIIGLCQGGWLSAIFASLYPKKVKRLIVAGTPINAKAGGGYLQNLVETYPQPFFESLVALGDGLMKGQFLLFGWKAMNPIERMEDYFILWSAIGTDKLENISCPVISIAGEKDDITLIPQALALPGTHIVIPEAGHIGIFMSRKSQAYWQEIL